MRHAHPRRSRGRLTISNNRQREPLRLRVTSSGRTNHVHRSVSLNASRRSLVAVSVAEFVRADHLRANHLLRHCHHVGGEVRGFERDEMLFGDHGAYITEWKPSFFRSVRLVCEDVVNLPHVEGATSATDDADARQFRDDAAERETCLAKRTSLRDHSLLRGVL